MPVILRSYKLQLASFSADTNISLTRLCGELLTRDSAVQPPAYLWLFGRQYTFVCLLLNVLNIVQLDHHGACF